MNNPVCDNVECCYKSIVVIKKEEAKKIETFHFIVNQSKHFPQEYVSVCTACVEVLTDARKCNLCDCNMADRWIQLFDDERSNYCRECLPDKFILSFQSLRHYKPLEAATLLSLKRTAMRPDIKQDAMKIMGSLTHPFRKKRIKQCTRKRAYELTLCRNICKWVPLLTESEAGRLVKHRLIDESVMDKTPIESLDTMGGLEFITWLMIS